VRKHYPPVAAALDWLAQFALARMSGTGSCVFAAFDDRETAQDILDMLPDPAWRGFVARGLNCSPLATGFHEQG
jgi:4-diphosphocytidyl-2-C-methyl-D-erythritol kinase